MGSGRETLRRRRAREITVFEMGLEPIRDAMSPLFLAALCLCLGSASAAPAQDAVLSLPEYGAPPTPQYSGFLDASAADYEAGVQLHYWLATSSSPDQATAPVVLWLNGGPGSSSILGMLQEHGPLIMNATGGLTENPYTWTKDVSVQNMTEWRPPRRV